MTIGHGRRGERHRVRPPHRQLGHMFATPAHAAHHHIRRAAPLSAAAERHRRRRRCAWERSRIQSNTCCLPSVVASEPVIMMKRMRDKLSLAKVQEARASRAGRATVVGAWLRFAVRTSGGILSPLAPFSYCRCLAVSSKNCVCFIGRVCRPQPARCFLFVVSVGYFDAPRRRRLHFRAPFFDIGRRAVRGSRRGGPSSSWQ